jgi:beta-lactamase regulating signal transducer with metallopeptidase domain
MTLLLDSVLKTSVILGAALLVALFLRNRSAAIRHWLLSSAVLCAAVMPLATLVLPSWSLGHEISQALPLQVLSYTVHGTGVSSALPPVKQSNVTISVEWLPVAWLAGSSVALFALALGFLRLAFVALRSRRVTDGEWIRTADNIARKYGLRRGVRLLQSESPAMLITWGALRPRILLPQGAELWPEERISVVLHHELAHVRRHDWLLHTIAELVRVVYWFNPLVWMVCKRLRIESEYVADNAVLAEGFSGPRYAGHLLEIVRTLQQPDRAWSAASAMARPSTIERRFAAMLNSVTDRRLPSRLVTVTVGIGLLCTSLSLAALSAPAPIPVVVREVIAVTAPVVEHVAPEPESAPAPVAPTPKPQVPLVQTPAPPQPTQYTGEIINLDLKETDIRDFFRLIGEISGRTVVLDGDVKGTITIQFRGLPWDQGLDIVLRNYNLVGVLQGNVLRIASKATAASEESIRQAAGRTALEFEVFRNGISLWKTIALVAPQNVFTLNSPSNERLSVSGIQVTPSNVQLDFEFGVSSEKFAAKGLAVSKDSPGKVLWQMGGNTFEVRVSIPTAP